MASRVNQNSTPAEKFRNIRTNLTNGEKDYYYPLEVTDDSILVYAREHNLEVGPARLGYRKFRAVFVPCKEQAIDSHGHVTFLDTPSDVQRRRYLDLIKDEMDAQERAKEDGRCCISDGRGGIKRCPLRIPNPTYKPENGQPKTVAVHCEGCVFEAYKQEHSFVTLSALEQENDAGEPEPYKVPAPKAYYAADEYEKLAQEFVAFVRERKPKLAPLAEKLTEGFSKSEAGRELGDAWGTVTSRTDKLKSLLLEFLNQVITF